MRHGQCRLPHRFSKNVPLHLKNTIRVLRSALQDLERRCRSVEGKQEQEYDCVNIPTFLQESERSYRRVNGCASIREESRSVLSMPIHDAKRRNDSLSPNTSDGVQRSSRQHAAVCVTDSVTDNEHIDRRREDYSVSASFALLSLPVELVEGVLACLPASELLRATLVSSSLATQQRHVLRSSAQRKAGGFQGVPEDRMLHRADIPGACFTGGADIPRRKTAFEPHLFLCGANKNQAEQHAISFGPSRIMSEPIAPPEMEVFGN